MDFNTTAASRCFWLEKHLPGASLYLVLFSLFSFFFLPDLQTQPPSLLGSGAILFLFWRQLKIQFTHLCVLINTVGEPYCQDKTLLCTISDIWIHFLVVLNLNPFPLEGSKKHKNYYLKLWVWVLVLSL